MRVRPGGGTAPWGFLSHARATPPALEPTVVVVAVWWVRAPAPRQAVAVGLLVWCGVNAHETGSPPAPMRVRPGNGTAPWGGSYHTQDIRERSVEPRDRGASNGVLGTRGQI